MSGLKASVLAAVVLVLSFLPAVAHADDLDDDESQEKKPAPAPPKGPELPPADPAPGLMPERNDPYLARENMVAPSLVWLVAQAIPSPSLVVGGQGAAPPPPEAPAEGGAHFGLRWHVTPFLYSFGIHRRLSPVRTLVVEPVVRQSGSVELLLTPEWVSLAGGKGLFSVGARATLPLLHRGEYLSASLGVAHTWFDGTPGVRYEAGVHALFGLFGLVATVSPTPAHSPVATMLTLDLRYF